MNLKRKPPTVCATRVKKPRPSDEKAAANALLLLLNSKENAGNTTTK